MLPALTKTLINRVRSELKGKGFSLVNTLRHFRSYEWNVPSHDAYISLDVCPKWVVEYAYWQLALLKAALPDERIYCPVCPISLRKTKKYRYDVTEKPHTDGGWIRALITIEGQPTLLCLSEELIIPLKHTLFVTGSEREKALNIPGTLHRKPKTEEPRKFIVIGWGGYTNECQHK